MTIAHIARLLLENQTVEAEKKLVPNSIYCGEAQMWLDEAWKDVATLRRQTDELDKLLPCWKEKHAHQFDEQVVEVARRLAEKLEII